MFATTSCVEPLVSVIPDQGQDITLSFSCEGMTKAGEVAGVDNENLVKRIDYFIFPLNTNGEVAATATPTYSDYILTTDADKLAKNYPVTLSADDFATIFGSASSAIVFAVANYVDKDGANHDGLTPNTEIPANKKTWEGLHSLEVGATFFKNGGEGFELRWPRKMDPDDENLFFVMTGEKTITRRQSEGNNNIIPLERLASKVTVNFTYVDEVIDSQGIRWVPQSEANETRVYLSNAIEHTTLGGPLTRALVADSWATCTKPQTHTDDKGRVTVGKGTRDIFEYAYDFMKDITTTTNNGKKLAHYYTYPISLTEGDDNQPYIKLVLPWYGYRNIGTPESPNWDKVKQKEVYYKIVIPRGTINQPNKIYEFNVNVDIIGSDKEVQITGYEYVVKDWLDDGTISSNVSLGRYISLDLPKDSYDMYGDKVEILFVASSEVEISQLHIYSPNNNGDDRANRDKNEYVVRKDADGSLVYGVGSKASQTINGSTTTVTYSDVTYDASYTDAAGLAIPDWVSIEGTHLVVNHTLDLDLSSPTVDTTPYIFEVTLHLKGVDGTTFDRSVTITQYPPVYTQAVPSNDYHTVYLNKVQYSDNANDRRHVYTDHNNTDLGYINRGGGNAARVKTVVTITTLASIEPDYYVQQIGALPVIGDPRVKWSEKQPANPRFPTSVWVANDFDADYSDYLYADPVKSNYIAPKFMLASGFGGSANGKVAYINNVERCASYQEDGYPAGRWRLPTEAEILFCLSLAQRDTPLIPNPFYSTSCYWASTARAYWRGFTPTLFLFADNATANSITNNGDHDTASRCVYDLWYWGDQQYDSAGNPIPENSTTQPATQWVFKPTK